SGWSTLRTTLFAPLPVAPPDVHGPALASAPRINATGPLAFPPDERSCSFDERIRLRFSPDPDPPLNISPSSRYQFKIESMESSTARIKQALTCCGLDVPTLNHTGELKLKI